MGYHMPPSLHTLTPAAAKVHALTEILLHSEVHGELRSAAQDLYQLMCGFVGTDGHAPTTDEHANTNLPGGQAISPWGAGLCVLDYLRTTMFLRGVNTALAKAAERFPDETLEVLYAGCGLFATLVTSLAGRFNPEKVRFTLLDIHSVSLEGAKKVFLQLGLDPSLRECVIVDAAAYVPAKQPHVILVETMQRALDKEPQVAVTANLGAHLRAGGIFIPERITVDAYLEYDSRKTPGLMAVQPLAEDQLLPAPHRVSLGQLIDLTAKNAPTWRANPGNTQPTGPVLVPPLSVNLPADSIEALRIALITEVTVLDSLKLSDNESGITLPAFRRFKPNAGKVKIEFRYRTGNTPGFDYHWIKARP
ncbi:MAG: hypothetical protein JWO89_491 [Verrucomicrobiaceae bacterium]|nr:hypothetical protein [Verrucomicrobiaceae bacterium]